ncbi:MAG: O-acetylhomoserine aminocarboxypropyltransferase/cysteine synthase [Clostridia bacterium]|jgi:O-acetylhomoserine (thiol)-lyase|nr:O-acetylhomoserine aminocarboxypropyltransferase/cysteine synthase [Clostridia bacterium]
MAEKKWKFDTLAIRGGQQADPTTGAVAAPIYQTTSYQFQNPEHAARLFSLEEEGNIYTRIMNPTTDILEKRLSLLEGGMGALATASGQAAISLAICNLARQGDNIVASSSLYGGTVNLFTHTLPKWGIQVKWADPLNPEDFRQKIDKKTKAFYVETIGNPGLDIPNLEKLAETALQAGLPLIVDNTFASPYLCQPFRWGADIIIHSTTKYIGGHGNSLGGIIVDGGRFLWNKERFPEFNQPDPSYHGIIYQEEFQSAAFINKARLQLLRDLGPTLSPFNAFLLLQGLETLPLRMQRHCDNAMKVALYLADHPKVSWVNYPGLVDHPGHLQAKKYLQHGFGGILTFGVKNGFEAAKRVIKATRLFLLVANVGDARSLIIHPASTTHQQLTEQQLAACGVTPDLIRISVGLEDIEDLLEDLEQALEQI